MKIIFRFKYFLLTILTGALLIFSFPYPDLGFLAFFALIPLLIICYQLSPGKSFLYGLLTGIIFFSGISYWIAIYGYLPLVLLTLLMAFSFAIFAFLVSYARPANGGVSLIVRLFFVPSVWVFVEFLRSELGSWSFPYGVLGYSQHNFLLLLQFASILGVYGISFLVVMVNVVLAEFMVRLLRPLRFAQGPRNDAKLSLRDPDLPRQLGASRGRSNLSKTIIFVALIFAFVLGYGFIRLREAALGRTETSFQNLLASTGIRVAVVQVSIPQKLKWLASEEERIMEKYQRATLKAAKSHPDLIVLPESALPAYVTEDDALFQTVQGWAQRTKTPLLVGVPFIGNDNKSYNTARLFSSNGQVKGRYAKIYPVPFGEFTPVRPVTEKIRPDATVRGDVAPGKELTIFKLAESREQRAGTREQRAESRFSVLLCSESGYSNLARRMVARGANMLFVLTNNAWFFKTSQSDQHFIMSKFRAVENGRYLVQAANSGVSGFVTPDGQVLERSRLFEVTTLVDRVFFLEKKTFFARLGYLFPYLTLSMLLSGLLISAFRRY
jgi:apolipoprotein N-acyltransferase